MGRQLDGNNVKVKAKPKPVKKPVVVLTQRAPRVDVTAADLGSRPSRVGPGHVNHVITSPVPKGKEVVVRKPGGAVVKRGTVAVARVIPSLDGVHLGGGPVIGATNPGAADSVRAAAQAARAAAAAPSTALVPFKPAGTGMLTPEVAASRFAKYGKAVRVGGKIAKVGGKVFGPAYVAGSVIADDNTRHGLDKVMRQYDKGYVRGTNEHGALGGIYEGVKSIHGADAAYAARKVTNRASKASIDLAHGTAWLPAAGLDFFGRHTGNIGKHDKPLTHAVGSVFNPLSEFDDRHNRQLDHDAKMARITADPGSMEAFDFAVAAGKAGARADARRAAMHPGAATSALVHSLLTERGHGRRAAAHADAALMAAAHAAGGAPAPAPVVRSAPAPGRVRAGTGAVSSRAVVPASSAGRVSSSTTSSGKTGTPNEKGTGPRTKPVTVTVPPPPPTTATTVPTVPTVPGPPPQDEISRYIAGALEHSRQLQQSYDTNLAGIQTATVNANTGLAAASGSLSSTVPKIAYAAPTGSPVEQQMNSYADLVNAVGQTNAKTDAQVNQAIIGDNGNALQQYYGGLREAQLAQTTQYGQQIKAQEPEMRAKKAAEDADLADKRAAAQADLEMKMVEKQYLHDKLTLSGKQALSNLKLNYDKLNSANTNAANKLTSTDANSAANRNSRENIARQKAITAQQKALATRAMAGQKMSTAQRKVTQGWIDKHLFVKDVATGALNQNPDVSYTDILTQLGSLSGPGAAVQAAITYAPKSIHDAGINTFYSDLTKYMTPRQALKYLGQAGFPPKQISQIKRLGMASGANGKGNVRGVGASISDAVHSVVG